MRNSTSKVLQVALAVLIWAGLLFAAAPLPGPNGLLEVKVTKGFTPNPAFVSQTVETVFGLMFTTNKLTEEVQKFGIQTQTLLLRFEGGAGQISSVSLIGTTVLPGGKTQPFDHLFADLQSGKPQRFGDLTVTLNASGAEAVIKGGPSSPVIDSVKVRGTYGSPGDKQILLNASVTPKTAKGPAIGQAVAQGDVTNILVKINGTSLGEQKFDDDIVVRKAGKDDPANDGKTPIAGKKVLDLIPSIPMEIANKGKKEAKLFLEQTSTLGAAVSFWRDAALKQQIGKDGAVPVEPGKSATVWIVGEKESPLDMRDVTIKIHDGKVDGSVVRTEAVTVVWVRALEPRATGTLSPSYAHQDVFKTYYGLKDYKTLGVFNSKGGENGPGGLFGAIQLDGQVFPTNLKNIPFNIKDYKSTETGKRDRNDSVTATPLGFVWQRRKDGIRYTNFFMFESKGFDDSVEEVQDPIPHLAGEGKNKKLMIHDFDGPGSPLNNKIAKAGDEFRYRYNFVQWVTFSLNGKTFRASNKVGWHCALTGTVNAAVTLIVRDDKTFGKKGNEIGPGLLKKLTEDFK